MKYLNKLILLLIAITVYIACSTRDKTSNSSEFFFNKEPHYVGSKTCESCHQDEYDSWLSSDHFKAMLLPDSLSVAGSFEGETFVLDEVKYTTYKTDSSYFIKSEDNGFIIDLPIKYTFGFYPLQQYLIETNEKQLQVHRLTWDVKLNKWFHQREGEVLSNHDWLHWTNNSMNWSTMCASCHSTNVQKNFDQETWTYNTTFDEINVSCESCHGPGSNHLVSTSTKDSFSYQYGKIQKDNIIDLCASCHSRRTSVSNNNNPTHDFYNNYVPHLLTDDSYEPDGQIQDEDYVYSSFLSSKMYMNNVVCSDCHDNHTNKLKFKGNKLCTQCHVSSDYDTELHTHHPLNSSGGQCVDCHMDGKTYMGNDYRRDHSFRIPRPDQSLKFSTSNACVNCHTDNDNLWASNNIIEWFGSSRGYHFSDDLIPGSKLNGSSEKHLLHLLLIDTINPVVRATAISYLSKVLSNEGLNVYIASFFDNEAIVRQSAYQSLNNNQFLVSKYPQLIEGIKDKKKSVRVLAYRALFNLNIPPVYKSYFNAVRFEYEEMLNSNSDMINGQMQLGDYNQMLGDNEKAIKHYNKVIILDSLLVTPYLNSAILFASSGDLGNAMHLINKGLSKLPDNAYLWYYKGLIASELSQFELSISSIEKSISLDDNNPDAYYNLILLLRRKGVKERSVILLNEALNKFSNNEKIRTLIN